MKYLIFSDIHSNLDALRVLTAWAKRKKIDKYIVLGDLVGYGAAPNQVVDRIRALKPLEIVRGNHDKVASAVEDGSDFNSAAFQAALWTRQKLSRQNLSYLAGLPRGPRLIDDNFLICHGSPYDEDAYLFSDYDAVLAFATAEPQICFFGHTHVPRVYIQGAEGGVVCGTIRGDGVKIKIEPGLRYLINPGSLGQPRDRDPRLAFATYESERGIVTVYRKEYALQRTQAEILKAGLPQILATRLSIGV